MTDAAKLATVRRLVEQALAELADRNTAGVERRLRDTVTIIDQAETPMTRLLGEFTLPGKWDVLAAFGPGNPAATRPD